MQAEYNIQCSCGAVSAVLRGEPRVRGFCHCGDCRELLDVPYHSVTAWNPDQVTVNVTGDALVEYQHPSLRMTRCYCRNCGETIYNTNAMDWRVFSQLLIRKASGGVLPEALRSKSHFFYGRRIVDINDDLPKHD